ncbi:MAG: AAA family ATPase [Candidatus Bathyarchaeota archaeon]|nr:AAA family ATPase [Candidatus Bathyarchaeota archaeon]
MKVQLKNVLSDRVPTGITGLDGLIEGGFPRGGLILLAGSPGSGKSIASAHFIYHGAKNLDENGVYLSFAERRDFFFNNMKRFCLDFEVLESEGRFKFLDVMTAREEATSSTFDMAISEILEINATRLVVDSFSAMAQAFKMRIDARIILHMLNKLMHHTLCTTLLLVEIPTGSRTFGSGFEEFVADGIIHFETINENDGIRKRAVIRKMRNTNHNQNYMNIVISNEGISLMPYVT